MLMRYHFGLGVGHVYAWSNKAAVGMQTRGSEILETIEEDECDEDVPVSAEADGDDWDESGTESKDIGEEEDHESDNEEYLTRCEMYD